MRATRLLKPAELDHLETNCAVLGATWREHFAAAHGGEHTPKVHLIERHVVEQAHRHGTLRMFGEEAVEAEHPAWARAAQLCRAIKNPRARLLATKRRSEAKKLAAKIPHTKKSRVSTKQRLAAAAGGGGTQNQRVRKAQEREQKKIGRRGAVMQGFDSFAAFGMLLINI